MYIVLPLISIFVHTHTHTHTSDQTCYSWMVSGSITGEHYVTASSSSATEPTNMLDMRAVLWLEQYLKVKGRLV